MASRRAYRLWQRFSNATASRPRAAVICIAGPSASRISRGMPEGDTIFRTARSLRPAMEGGVIEAARIRDRQFECERIIGRTVTAVEPRGKHLLMHLDCTPLAEALSRDALAKRSASAPRLNPSPQGRGALIIHSHMGMTGSWHVYHPGQPWLKPTHYAALVLSIKHLEVICFSPRLLELLTADQLRRHPHIQRLGPDMLGVEFDMHSAIARFRAHNHLPLGEAVINQVIVCGIGNEYKSDLMFLFGLNPLSPVSRYTDEELTKLLEKARFLM